mgnify:CR=1 FL=1
MYINHKQDKFINSMFQRCFESLPKVWGPPHIASHHTTYQQKWVRNQTPCLDPDLWLYTHLLPPLHLSRKSDSCYPRSLDDMLPSEFQNKDVINFNIVWMGHIHNIKSPKKPDMRSEVCYNNINLQSFTSTIYVVFRYPKAMDVQVLTILWNLYNHKQIMHNMCTFRSSNRPHSCRTIAGAAQIAPTSFPCWTCSVVIFFNNSFSRSRADPGIPP